MRISRSCERTAGFGGYNPRIPKARLFQRIGRSGSWSATNKASTLAAATQPQNYSIDWFTIDRGGGTRTGGVYSVSGTIGPPDAGGPMIGGNQSGLRPEVTLTPAYQGSSVRAGLPTSPPLGFEPEARWDSVTTTNAKQSTELWKPPGGKSQNEP